MLHVLYIYQHLRIKWDLRVNVPAPWSIWGMEFYHEHAPKVGKYPIHGDFGSVLRHVDALFVDHGWSQLGGSSSSAARGMALLRHPLVSTVVELDFMVPCCESTCR